MPIDRRSLDKLQEVLGGDRSDLIEVVSSFLDEGPELLSVLKRSLQTSNLAEARRAAHSIKSNARDMGAIELAEISGRIEVGCIGGRLPDQIDADSLQAALVSSVDELRRIFDLPGGG